MAKSKNAIVVKCDENKIFVRADPDIYNQAVFDNSEANHQDTDVQIQSQEVAKDEARGKAISGIGSQG